MNMAQRIEDLEYELKEETKQVHRLEDDLHQARDRISELKGEILELECKIDELQCNANAAVALQDVLEELPCESSEQLAPKIQAILNALPIPRTELHLILDRPDIESTLKNALRKGIEVQVADERKAMVRWAW